MTRLGTIGAAVFLTVAGFFAPAGAADTQYGNVTVSCGEDRSCVASIRSEGEGPGSVLMFGRGPQSRARWTMSISTLGALADRGRAMAVSIDNGVGVTLQPTADYAPFVRPTDFYVTRQSALDRLMVRLTVGNALRVTYMDVAGVPHTDSFKLRGLDDALDAIDVAQRRVVGDRRFGPPEGLPPAPVVDRQTAAMAAGLPPQLMDWHASSTLCEALESAGLMTVAPVVGPLSETAMLYALPCSRSGDRVSWRLYLVETGEIGGVDDLAFAGWSPRFGWFGTDTLDAVAYDAGTRTLTGETRDLGGCAGRGTWTFDAYAFRLERFEAGTTCGAETGPWKPVYPDQPTR